METTAERLQYFMRTYGLTQVDILKRAEPYCKKFNIKLGKSDLSQFVNGKVKPGQSKLSILGMALGVNEGWLMGFDIPMERNEKADPEETVTSSEINPLDIQIAKLLLTLSDEKKAEALNYLRYLSERK